MPRGRRGFWLRRGHVYEPGRATVASVPAAHSSRATSFGCSVVRKGILAEISVLSAGRRPPSPGLG